MENILGDTRMERLWSRSKRLAGQFVEDEDTPDDLFHQDELLFPSAQVQVEDEIRKSRCSSPSCVSYHLEDETCDCESPSSSISKDLYIEQGTSYYNESPEVPGTDWFDGASHNDIPCVYEIPRCQEHEMAAIGVCIDKRILPGFSYTIRKLLHESFKSRCLFGGEAREVESIGRGYSRRITLKPVKGQINSNEDFFWTDSNSLGFAFSLQVVKLQDKFTLFDADQQPVGHVEIHQLQGAQKELSQKVLENGCVEKRVRVGALCKVDWFHEQDNNIVPLSGICVCTRESKESAKLIEIKDAKLGQHYGYRLIPGTCTSLRSLRVSGTHISDIPAAYTIKGIQTHHLPVIGTYVDERIVPGFYYRVQLGACGNKLFSGEALRLDSLGRGYAKRITFSRRFANRSSSEHFWSDSHVEGFGFEISAVRPGMEFIIKTKDSASVIGYAHVFRDDCAPQVELHHSLVEDETGCIGIMKKIHIDVKCIVTLDLSTKEDLEPHTMRVTGLATLFKSFQQAEAEIIKIEDIGLDSQLNILFLNQWQEIVFYSQGFTSNNINM